MTRRFVSSLGLRLCVETSFPDHHSFTAEAPLILGVHGFMDHAGSFMHLAPKLAPKHPLAFIDRRGYGHSGRLPQDSKARYDFFDHLTDIHSLLSHLNHPPVILMGHSIGSIITLLYAGAFPEHLAGLILIETFEVPAETEKAPKRLKDWVESRLSGPQAGKSYDSYAAAKARLRSAHPKIPAAILDTWAERGIARHPNGGAEFLADPRHRGREAVLFRDDLIPVFARQIKVPVLAVLGDQSPVKGFPSWLENFSDCQRVTIADAGHMLHLEKPDALLGALHPFLDRILASKPDKV